MPKTVNETETVLICSRMDEQVSRHFRAKEFACKDGCEFVLISKILVQVLEGLRQKIDEEIYINSGFRTPGHNKAVGGAHLSYHQYGMAADIRAKTRTPAELYKLLNEMMKGWGGLELHQNFVHVDVRMKEWRKK